MGLNAATYTQIDREEQLKGKELTFESLSCKVGTFRYDCVGRDRLGYKQYKYRNGVETELGDIEVSLWKKLIYRLIEQHNEMTLFNHLKVRYAKNGFNFRNKSDLEQHTLECFSSRIFDNPKWVDYIAFNEKYRPEILQNNGGKNENH